MIIREKHIRITPVLYEAIIEDFVNEGKYRDKNEFVTEAIKEKLEREFGSLDPKTNIVYENIYDIPE